MAANAVILPFLAGSNRWHRTERSDCENGLKRSDGLIALDTARETSYAMSVSVAQQFQQIAQVLLPRAHDYYGDNLVTFAVYGSVARGLATAESDIDLLLVVADLPQGANAAHQCIRGKAPATLLLRARSSQFPRSSESHFAMRFSSSA